MAVPTGLEDIREAVARHVDERRRRVVQRRKPLPGLTLPTNESEAAEGPDTASVNPQDLMADWRLYWEGEN